METTQDVGHKQMVIIIFNPDKYTNDIVKITSCWAPDGNNIMVVKKSKENEWSERMNAFNNQIQYWVENPTDKIVEIIQLFY